MSSGVGAMYDDHNDYLRLCEAMGEEPVIGLPLASYKEWDAHWTKLKKKASRDISPRSFTQHRDCEIKGCQAAKKRGYSACMDFCQWMPQKT